MKEENFETKMEELEKIYCTDPYEFETELIGKSFSLWKM